MSVHDLQAPSQDGAILVHPAPEKLEAIVQEARALLSGASISPGGIPLSSLRQQARYETRQQVASYYQETGEPLTFPTSEFWLVGGHQPELFHPGVWLKNFFLAGQGARLGAVALNLMVDNDAAHPPVLRMPGRRRILSVPYDAGRSDAPYEERDVNDEGVFDRLPHAVSELIRDWPRRPLLFDYWIDVHAQARHTRNLGERFARARRQWERRFGIHPIELPVSRLSRTASFRFFATHLLAHAAAFREAYNAAVASYRQRHGLKSKNHPVPDLAKEGDWIETPFWAWRAGVARRSRLHVRQQDAGIELRADGEQLTLQRTTAAAMLEKLEGQGWKLRPRALSLTLFVRLFLADVFVHGLGGGKYDEVTDQIIRSFFNGSPPPYFVVTGTLRLPLQRHNVNEDDARRVRWRLRDLMYNPQRHIRAQTRLSPRERETLMTKAILMRYEPHRHKERKDRFFQMRHLNEDLQGLVAEQTRETRAEIEQIERMLKENAVLSRRDYAYCLYPEDLVRDFVSRVGASAPF